MSQYIPPSEGVKGPADAENSALSDEKKQMLEGFAPDEDAHKSSSATFIRRPIFTFVLNALIVIAGIAAYFAVDVRELPDIDRPIVSVVTSFKGASAATVDREVTQIVENAISRVSGVKNISSRSIFGRSRVVIEFNDGVDLSAASSDVRDVIARIIRSLPYESDAPVIIKADSNASSVMLLAVTSDSMHIEDLSILVDEQIAGALSAVDGVADVQTNGARDKIFRIEISQAKLARYGLTIADISKALSTMSFDAPVGVLRSSNQTLTVRAIARLQNPRDFENIYINDRVRIRDVANVILGKDIENSIVRINGKTAIGLGIIRQARSNTLKISQAVHETVERLNEVLPKDVHISVISDDAFFIKGAIHEVEIALFISIFGVVAVIFSFLWDWRATLIPALSIPVAMIGTLAAIYLAGFSLNILTLLAFVLATGLVVDDAIVVLENIVRRRNFGIGARAAAVFGTREVFFAVIATTLTLVAVFVPISFLPGQAGGLFREFGFVLSISILLSAFVALTLCPMLASQFLKGHSHKTVQANEHYEGPSLLKCFGQGFYRFYEKSLKWCLDNPIWVVFFSIVFLIFSGILFKDLHQELTPKEDRGQIFLSISAPQGVSVDYLNQQIQQVEERIQPLIQAGDIEYRFAVAGTSGTTNHGFLMLTLAPWEKRQHVQQQIVKNIRKILADITSIRVFPYEGNSLNIRGAGQGLRFAILGTNYDALQKAADNLIASMQKDKAHRFNQPRLGVDITQPQIFLRVNREKAIDLGINIEELARLLQVMLDGHKIGSIYIGDRSYDVKLASVPNSVHDVLDLKNIFMKTQDNRFVPLSTIAALEEKPEPPEIDRESRMRAVSITTGIAGDVGLGDAYKAVLKIAKPLLPPGSYIIPLAEAATLGETSSGLMMVFGFAVVIILLVLAAQFENFISAFIIMATIPLGLGCAIFALYFSGISLNVYSQIGLILLVGIMAKNGILIVEFADQLRDKGFCVREAIAQASCIRLRPVSMTMICAVLGGVPLIFAEGAGAEARVSLGWVIVGGLGLATIATLYVTPVTYHLLARFIKPRIASEKRLEEEMRKAQNK